MWVQRVHRGRVSTGADARINGTVAVKVKHVIDRGSVRLKLAFCMTCVVRVLVLAQGPSFLRLRRALLGQKGDSQVERKVTITSGKVKIIQTKCFTFTKEIRSGLKGETFAGVTSEPGGGIRLDCSRS